MQFDLHRVPFSRAGSYLTIAWLSENAPFGAGLYLRTVSGSAQYAEICRIDILRDESIQSVDIRAEPDLLTLRAAEQTLQWFFADAQTLRCAGEGFALQLAFPLRTYDHAIPRPGGWQVNSFSNRMSYALFAREGDWRITTSTDRITATAQSVNGKLDISLCEFKHDWPQNPAAISFDVQRQQCTNEFRQWLAKIPQVPTPFAEARELAVYVLWSARVAPRGLLRRPAVLMSKNWMTNVWSWDHCFTAMALIDSDPALAWDQFMIPFDAQDESGALPDCINDAAAVWNFCKPPIHGWTLRWMLENSPAISDNHLREIYQPLCRWTEWWLTRRDDRHTGLPQYNHGNDSGWDNSTLFDAGTPIATPELSAFLVTQMQVQADIAAQLGLDAEAAYWKSRADELLQRLIATFWRDDHFVARRVEDGSEIVSDTLLLRIPIILGKILPQTIRNRLLTDIGDERRFMTAHGLASESTHSPHYAADSYWRGPIWAPVMVLVIESLREIGAGDLAQTLGERFCKTVASAGMYENFDALSGQGYRDPAHAWTAAAFLILAKNLTT